MLVLHLLMTLTPDKYIVQHVIEDTRVYVFIHSADRLMELAQLEQSLFFVILAFECLHHGLSVSAKRLDHELLHVLLLHVIGVIVKVFTIFLEQVILANELLKVDKDLMGVGSEVLVENDIVLARRFNAESCKLGGFLVLDAEGFEFFT